MPSPVAHTLIGLSAAAAWRLPPGWRSADLPACLRSSWTVFFFAVVLANLPDLDYLPGLLTGDLNAFHHGRSHALLWGLVAGLGCWCLARAVRPGLPKTWLLFCLLLPVSHLVADVWTLDTRPPVGIPLGWPWVEAPFSADAPLFPNFAKGTLAELFSVPNLRPVLTELLLGSLLLTAVLASKKVRRPRACPEPRALP